MASSDCKNILDLIPLYIDNMLSEEETDTVCKHLAHCESCKNDFEFMKSLMNSTKNLPEIDVPADFHKKLISRVRTKNKKSYLKLKRIGAFAAAAAVIALSLVTLSDIGINKKSENPDAYIKQNSNISDSPMSLTATDKSDEQSDFKKADVSTVKASAPIVTEQKKNSVNIDEKSSFSTETDMNIHTAVSLDDENVFKTATITLTDENKSFATEILSAYEKDEIGYVVADIDDVLDKLSELEIKISIEQNGEMTKNYIIIK